ncbi:jg27979 [Pararge aegeria aegeria]|uniref:Jg27979 protein n=1 Tax=Pararge aegeria aegeria TaxID=348720 RepID=A0A8S4QY50_9NEOP|nr:jg27979 [Pararge aegeria aegeria]
MHSKMSEKRGRQKVVRPPIYRIENEYNPEAMPQYFQEIIINIHPIDVDRVPQCTVLGGLFPAATSDIKSFVHLVWVKLTLRLPVRGHHSNILGLLGSSVLRVMCPACH